LLTANLLIRLSGLATIYATGILLSKNDFALYAITIAWGEIFGFMQNGGLHRLMMQRARSYGLLYAPVFGLALAINGIWFFLLFASAPAIADIHQADEVKTLLVLFGLSLPAGTMALLLRARMLIDLRFSELSALNLYSALLRSGGVILLAIAGFGAMSFIIPIIMVALFESIYLYRRCPAPWRPSLPRRRLVSALARPMAWIMTGGFALSLVANGDYLAIGVFEDKAVVGVYFFGFQLTVAVFSLFTRSLRSVMVPSLVALKNDRKRQEAAFLRSLEAGSLLLFFVFFFMAAIARPLIGWVWSEKWDAAAPVIEIVAVACLARAVSPLAQSLLEARGAWRSIAAISWIEGLSLMAAAALGTHLGGLLAIAIAVGVHMTLTGLFYLYIIHRHTWLSILLIEKSVLVPYALASAALAVAWTLGAVGGPFQNALIETLVKGGGFGATYLAFVFLFQRHLIDTALALIKTLRKSGAA
jgi:O-antigen/teichoic acid export membrane protein